jgi:cytochrome P450
MSHFAFGKTYTASEAPEAKFVVDIMHIGGTLVGLVALIPWVFRILRVLPLPNSPLDRFDRYGHDLVVERRATGPAHPDVFQYMLAPFEATKEKTPELELQLESDALTIAIAGTDTTAAALTATLWYLATNPKHIQILRSELASIAFDPAAPDHAKLASLRHLRAVIDESLRLSPPAPITGIGWRITPPEGLQLGTRFVPGGVQVFVAPYVTHHDERFFVHAEAFVPERWTDAKAELVREGALFMPFSMGPHGCVGKALALAEIRLSVASLVAQFDVEVGKGETQETFRKKQKDMLTMMYGDIRLVFQARE